MEKCIILLEHQNRTGVASWNLAVRLLHLQACGINTTTHISIGNDGNSTAVEIVSETDVCMAKNDLEVPLGTRTISLLCMVGSQ